MAIARYIERAFKRRNDLNVYTVGPYTHNWMPWNGGMYLPERYASPPDVEVDFYNGIPIQMVERKVLDAGIDWDVWIQIDASFHFKGAPSKGVHAYIATDPHCVDYRYQRTQADVFFNMQRYYAQEGDIYLPYAYDPEFHSPPSEPIEPEWDLVLLGLHYSQRNLVIKQLMNLGVKVHYTIGPIFDEAKSLYNRARVGFHWSSLYDMNARVFELMAFGIPSTMNVVPDMDHLFTQGIDYLPFNTQEEAVENILWLLRDEDLRREIRDNALKTVNPHTWDARVEKILEHL